MCRGVSNIFDRRFKHTTVIKRFAFANIQIGLNQKTPFSNIFNMRSSVFSDIRDPYPLLAVEFEMVFCGPWTSRHKQSTHDFIDLSTAHVAGLRIGQQFRKHLGG